MSVFQLEIIDVHQNIFYSERSRKYECELSFPVHCILYMRYYELKIQNLTYSRSISKLNRFTYHPHFDVDKHKANTSTDTIGHHTCQEVPLAATYSHQRHASSSREDSVHASRPPADTPIPTPNAVA